MEKKYQRAKMVNWFEPAMLFQTGIKSVVSNLFGNYADKREMEAALPDNTSTQDWDKLRKEYIGKEEIWIDFISDTGDGFDSTYSIAKTVAEQKLVVKDNGVDKEIRRGKILILGGDQIYPTPTSDLYDTKFRVPFRAAFPTNEHDEDRPHMYAIPGNHDWYDGLGNFIKVFCQKRWIGNWETHQHRSYFAFPLPYNYWVWATDIQLNEDIDQPQLDYFQNIATSEMKPGDKIILCTAEPAWIYKHLYKEDKSYDRFNFFIGKYILQNRMELTVALTGDLHHYSHYCARNEVGESDHYFGAGGGGAFLHLTHGLPDKLELNGKDISLQKVFPEKKESYKLLAGNLVFPFKNRYFSFLIGAIYLLFFWLLQSRSINLKPGSYMKAISTLSFSDFVKYTQKILLISPFICILSLVIIGGFYKFTDTKSGKEGVKLFGLLHGILQCFFIFLFIWLLGHLHYSEINPGPAAWYWKLIFILELIIGGGLVGGFIMGLYLYTSNLLFGNHIDESSSSLACADYKNFLRMHITQQGLTIYPVGIKKVTKKWKQSGSGDDIKFEGNLPEYHLIENSIFIKN
jgi:hypothetical protein